MRKTKFVQFEFFFLYLPREHSGCIHFLKDFVTSTKTFRKRYKIYIESQSVYQILHNVHRSGISNSELRPSVRVCNVCKRYIEFKFDIEKVSKGADVENDPNRSKDRPVVQSKPRTCRLSKEKINWLS